MRIGAAIGCDTNTVRHSLCSSECLEQEMMNMTISDKATELCDIGYSFMTMLSGYCMLISFKTRSYPNFTMESNE